jgi:23S rRNA (guanosine2251-2'-O)-methyltransferase
VTSSRPRNDRKPHWKGKGHAARAPGDSDWVWGRHAVLAALANPMRQTPRRLLASPGVAKDLTDRIGKLRPGVRVEVEDGADIGRMLPHGAVHQGLAALIDPLEPVDLMDLAQPAQGLLVMLDQVTDPQNVGAILRSAAAFGARGMILQERRAPMLSGSLAKAAAGAADVVPVARVTNLSRALEELSELGWRSVGLAGEAEHDLRAVLVSGPTVLVLGSEGEGLRRLVAEHCDTVARIPMRGDFESLNVSNAAAVALYEASLLA